MLPSRDSSHRKRHLRLKVKGWEKTYHSHGLNKKGRVSILISDKVDIKPKIVRWDKEGHLILLNETIKQEDIMIISIYAPSNGASMYIK